MEKLGIKPALKGHIFPGKYIQRFDDCKEKVLKILRKLKPSKFEVKKNERALRASG